jgi:hypothetical protein
VSLQDLAPRLRRSVGDPESGALHVRRQLGTLVRALQSACLLSEADGDDEKHAAATLHIRRHLLRDHDPENDPAYPALLDRVLADDV